MKKYIYIVVLMCIGMQAYAQTYEELVGKAMDAVEADSLYDAEKFFKEALNKEPANMGNSLLLSNLGTIQRRAQLWHKYYSRSFGFTPGYDLVGTYEP